MKTPLKPDVVSMNKDLRPFYLKSNLYRRAPRALAFHRGAGVIASRWPVALLRRIHRLAEPGAFAEWLAPLRTCEWVVYAKRPFAGPEAVLAYLSRYTHRVAISNRRLVALDEDAVTFRWKDYRAKGRTRFK